MRLSEAAKYRAAIELSMDGTVDDVMALEVPKLFPVWDPAAIYEAGKRVRHEGVLYKCLQAHTAQEGWDPVSAPSLWAMVLIPDETEIPQWEQPDSTNAYQIGDKVSHNGSLWISVVADNVWEPGVYGWEDLTDVEQEEGT